jgi:VanZ family protein
MYLENNQARRVQVHAFIAWFLLVLWMLLIFLMSSQNGTESGTLSRGIAEGILRLLKQPADAITVTAFEGIIRTLAHGGVFFVLAILAGVALAKINIQDIRNTIITFIGCTLYAVSDEWHQSFVPGRASQWEDFGVDLLGIALAILIYQSISAVHYLRTESSRSKRPKKG